MNIIEEPMMVMMVPFSNQYPVLIASSYFRFIGITWYNHKGWEISCFDSLFTMNQ